jgi:CubicO group peptidase (beta-lactamase class C family)
VLGPPDDLYSYSSTGYWLAAYVMEKATGEYYADLVAKHVFAPLGMTRSTLRPLMAFTYPVALDHRVGPDFTARVVRPYPDDASTWAGGSVFSSVDELARLALALLDSGRIDGQRVLPASVVSAMRTPQASEGDGPCAYTFGLSRCEHGGGAVTLGHYGFRSGSGAVFTLLPEQRAAVIILSNRNGGIFGRTEQVALRELAGRALAADEPATPSATTERRGNLADFVGSYVSAGDTLRIARKGNGLVLRYGGSEQPMRVTGERSIAIVDDEGNPQEQFELVRGKKSGATYLHDGISAFRRLAP